MGAWVLVTSVGCTLASQQLRAEGCCVVQLMSLPHMTLDYWALERLSQAAASGDLDNMEESFLWSQHAAEPMSAY